MFESIIGLALLLVASWVVLQIIQMRKGDNHYDS
jgi:hypothetical protein